MPDSEMKVVFEGEADARLIANALLSPIAGLVGQMDTETLKWWRRRDPSDYTERVAAIERAWTSGLQSSDRPLDIESLFQKEDS